MTINNRERFYAWLPAGFDGEFDWDFLKGHLPRGIEPMDFDAVIELGGKFLVFETKLEGTPVKKGPAMLFQRLLQIPEFTVFMIYGKTPETISRVIWCKGKGRKDHNPCTLDQLIWLVKSWAAECEGRPPPTYADHFVSQMEP